MCNRYVKHLKLDTIQLLFKARFIRREVHLSSLKGQRSCINKTLILWKCQMCSKWSGIKYNVVSMVTNNTNYMYIDTL